MIYPHQALIHVLFALSLPVLILPMLQLHQCWEGFVVQLDFGKSFSQGGSSCRASSCFLFMSPLHREPAESAQPPWTPDMYLRELFHCGIITLLHIVRATGTVVVPY